MTPGIILTHVTLTATWHDDILTRDNFFDFFLKNSKIKLKIKKKLIKKFKKLRN